MSEAKLEQQFLNDLDAKLWNAADKLCSNLDAANYKQMVLGFIFLKFKYLSDAFEERREELRGLFTSEAEGNNYHLPRANYDTDEAYRKALDAELEQATIDLVLQQAEELSNAWTR